MYNYKLKSHFIKIFKTPYIVNNPIYQYAFRRHVDKVIKSSKEMPTHLVIENTNACNSNCIMCAHSKMKRKIGSMNMNLFKKIIDEYGKYEKGYVSIQGFGEPLIDPLFDKRVKYAKKSGIKKVITNTNASLLNEKKAKKILNSGLDEIFINLDGFHKETYENIRRNLKFDVVTNNIIRFLELRDELGLKKPIVNLDFILLEKNKFEVNQFVNKWKNKVDNICISSVYDWIDQTQNISVDNFHTICNTIKRPPCRLLWTELVVSWNGEVPLCCRDYDNNIVLGNLRNQTIKDVWTGEKIEKIRQSHLNGNFEIPLCKDCNYYSVWWEGLFGL